MKKIERPEIKIIKLDTKDVICCSGENGISELKPRPYVRNAQDVAW